MSDAPVRKPRLYNPMLAIVAECMEDHQKVITELAEDLLDHLQISGRGEMTVILALVSALNHCIDRERKLHGLDAERAYRLIFAEQLLEMED
jgi:hypothetical protein